LIHGGRCSYDLQANALSYALKGLVLWIGSSLVSREESYIAEASRTATLAAALKTNEHLIRWVKKMAKLTQPSAIHWVDGTEEKNAILCRRLVTAGNFTSLDSQRWSGCFYARSSPNDVTRVDQDKMIVLRLAARSPQ
jgi:GTP-dependent phosphoenolpyruvate carboxykinase